MTAVLDRNAAFTAERRNQIGTARQRQADIIAADARRAADFTARIESGKITPLGDGRYRVTDPGSWDDGEVWIQRQANPNGTALVLPEHNLDETTGQVALYSRTPAWHELGQIVPEGVNSIDAVLKLAGLDFDIVQRPAQYRGNDGELLTFPGMFVNTRSDTGLGLGIVGNIYQPFQPVASFLFLQSLADQQDVLWESAGALYEGRKVFVCMRLPEDIVIDAKGVNDTIRPFINAIDSYDGRSQFEVVVTPWRVECGNTERFAVRDAHTRWQVRHTTNAQARLAEARRSLKMSHRYYEGWAEEANGLAQTAMSRAAFEKFLGTLWEAPKEGAPKVALTNHTARTDTLVELFDANAARLGRTAYAAERALTEYADWKAAVRPRGSLRGRNLAARATVALEGGKDELKTRAHRGLLTLVRR